MAKECYCSGCENQRRIAKRKARIAELVTWMEEFNSPAARSTLGLELRKLLKELRVL